MVCLRFFCFNLPPSHTLLNTQELGLPWAKCKVISFRLLETAFETKFKALWKWDMNTHFCKSLWNRSSKFGNSNTLLGEFQCYFKYMLWFWSTYILLFVYVILFVDWCGLSSNNILVSTKMQFLAPLLLQKAFASWDISGNCFCSSGDSPLPGLGMAPAGLHQLSFQYNQKSSNLGTHPLSSLLPPRMAYLLPSVSKRRFHELRN